jgi:hypothetical protein
MFRFIVGYQATEVVERIALLTAAKQARRPKYVRVKGFWNPLG